MVWVWVLPAPGSPLWLLASAAIGTFAAILAQIVSHFLIKDREDRRFAIQSFERFRSQFIDNPELNRISKKYYNDDEGTAVRRRNRRLHRFASRTLGFTSPRG